MEQSYEAIKRRRPDALVLVAGYLDVLLLPHLCFFFMEKAKENQFTKRIEIVSSGALLRWLSSALIFGHL